MDRKFIVVGDDHFTPPPPAPAVAGGLPRVRLSRNVAASFRMVFALPSDDPIQHPMSATRTVCQMPDGRYVAMEVAGTHDGADAVVLGAPISGTDALRLAMDALAADDTEDELHRLAVAFLGLFRGSAK